LLAQLERRDRAGDAPAIRIVEPVTWLRPVDEELRDARFEDLEPVVPVEHVRLRVG
jgi:hypothetical protein